MSPERNTWLANPHLNQIIQKGFADMGKVSGGKRRITLFMMPKRASGLLNWLARRSVLLGPGHWATCIVEPWQGFYVIARCSVTLIKDIMSALFTKASKRTSREIDWCHGPPYVCPKKNDLCRLALSQTKYMVWTMPVSTNIKLSERSHVTVSESKNVKSWVTSNNLDWNSPQRSEVAVIAQWP